MDTDLDRFLNRNYKDARIFISQAKLPMINKT